MAPLKVEQYVVGPVQTNCYFAVNDETKEMILIDPGANADLLPRAYPQRLPPALHRQKSPRPMFFDQITFQYQRLQFIRVGNYIFIH